MAIDREKIQIAAQKYVEKKKYDKAVIEYQKVIQEDPNDARTLLKIGDLQSKMDDYAGAVGTYERVGKYYASQGFSLKAIAVYKQIREIISKHVPHLEEKYAHITPKLADLYQQLGLTSDALAALDEVATRLQRQGREPDAVEVFRKIVQLNPSNPLPHLRLAEALSRGKDTDGAVAEFAVASGLLDKLGRRDDALKVIERLLQHKPEAVHARTAAQLYLARSAPNDGLQALAKLQICFQANPRDLETLALLSRAFTHIGQSAKAIEVQKEMARIARDSGKTELFREILDRLLELVPNDEVVRRLKSGSDAPAPPSEAAMRSKASIASLAPDEDEEAYEDVGDTDIHETDQAIELAARREENDGVDTSLEVVEETREPSDQDRAQVAQILSDAASFRRARLPLKAVAILRNGKRSVPQSIEVREVLCEVLVEGGRQDEAVAELLELAELRIDGLDLEGATRTLQDVLALDSQNALATGMLHELGYEVVEDSTSVDELAAENGTATALRVLEEPEPLESRRDEAAENGPLPSYDLEEVGPEDVARHAGAARGRLDSFEDVDNPFAESPLPRFSLEAPTESHMPRRGPPPPAAEAAPPPSDEAASPAPPRSGAELESALEEAEFFTSRGLYDDARSILDEQLARLPDHPLLLERLAELEAQERSAQGGSGTRPSPAAGVVEDRAFDIAESLGALETLNRPSGVGSSPMLPGPDQQVDVEEVFAKFKEGVAKQIGVDDAQSHYDLGLAYKDMGLIDDAIREFETAARDPKHACVCHSMIGMIHLELGNVNDAIDALTRGLQAPERTKDQEASLAYELGAAYEVKKMNKQALESFQHVSRLNPGFRDVAERIRRLQKPEAKPPSRAVAVGADDEFNRAFDDILGKRP